MKKIALTSILFLSIQFALLNAQTGIYVEELKSADEMISDFMKSHDLPGGTFAIAKDGRLMYARAFGYADHLYQELTQPYHLFRIASVSKSITSIAIMKLMQEKKLKLSDLVFGPEGIINDSYFTEVIKDERIYKITIRQLLEHTAGWDKDISGDPPFFPLEVTQALGEQNPVTDSALIKYLLKNGLDFSPGKRYAYSNVGFLILGRIIEKETGQSYEDYVKDNILYPLNIYDMHIGKTLVEDKQEREAEYFSPYYDFSCYGDNSWVPRQYGGWHVEAMNAHGGWIATARDLVRLLVAVDGFDTKPDILTDDTVRIMTTPSSKNSGYAKGWFVNTLNNWWHTGSLDGTRSLWVRTNHGFAWAAIINSREGVTELELDDLMWGAVKSGSVWPDHDFFKAPTYNASEIIFSKVRKKSVNIEWKKGNGEKRLVIMNEVKRADQYPKDGESYNPRNGRFKSGDNLGSGNYIVYNGNGERVTVTNLKPKTSYRVRVYEYNEINNKPLYLLSDSKSVTVRTKK